ncbi:O-antigen ligase family protein [Exiguobacterium sp. s5]|uniref:O-antigen ligase family protein n=1 Tax=Exiguobacterium sp. s5 TaxID=2751239 RepID=UPI001BE71C48|nr:O-antigen ligase family protein [Exiguobacterium sp. s5]
MQISHTRDSRKKHITTDYTLIFFFSIFLTLVFAVNDTEILTKVYYVFNVRVNEIVVITSITLMTLFLSLLKNPKFDKVFLFLFVSLILGIVPLLYVDTLNSYWGNFYPLIVSLTAYYVCSQSKVDFTERVYQTLLIVSLILSLQVVYTEFQYFSSLSFGNLSNVSIKGAMNIPIGSSNMIAAFLAPIIIFLLSYKRNVKTWGVVLISFYAILLCRSKNAILILSIFLLISIISKMFKRLMRDQSLTPQMKVPVIIGVIISLIGIFALFIDFANTVITDLRFAYYSPYMNTVLNYLDTISSGRIYVYHMELKRFSEHLFFGNGFGYEFGQARSHNWLLELLVQKGLVGFFIYLLCIFYVIKSGLAYKSDKFVFASLNLLAVIYLQGLFEVTIFTTGIDFLIWGISGFVISRVNYIKKHGLEPKSTSPSVHITHLKKT